MLIDAGTLFSVILYILGCILLIVLIILSIKAIKTVGKINNLVDDMQEKSNKINGVFDIVDSTTDFISSVTDKIVGGVSNMLIKFFDKKGNKEDE